MPKRMQELPAEYYTAQHALARAIGARLRQRRKEMKLTQDRLRARMELEHIYISRTHYSRIENGEALPDAALLIGLQIVFERSFAWLLLGDEGKK